MNSRSRPDAEATPANKGSRFVLQPDEGTSYWQPRPANGYATVKVNPDNCSSNQVTMGMQAVAPGGYVREHWHSRNEEILFCFEGAGAILVDGEPHYAAFVSAVECDPRDGGLARSRDGS